MKILIYEKCTVCNGGGVIKYAKMNANISSPCFNCGGEGRVPKYVARREFSEHLLKFKNLGEAEKGLPGKLK